MMDYGEYNQCDCYYELSDQMNAETYPRFSIDA